jgi:hypothetical protein
MRSFRTAMKSVSTTWAAADFSRLARAVRIAATAVATIAVVGLAAIVAVAISLP